MLQRQANGILESHFWGSKGLRRSGHTERRCNTSLLLYFTSSVVLHHICSSVSNLKISCLHDSVGGRKEMIGRWGDLKASLSALTFSSLLFFPSSSALPTCPVSRLLARTEGFSLALILKPSFTTCTSQCTQHENLHSYVISLDSLIFWNV